MLRYGIAFVSVPFAKLTHKAKLAGFGRVAGYPFVALVAHSQPVLRFAKQPANSPASVVNLCGRLRLAFPNFEASLALAFLKKVSPQFAVSCQLRGTAFTDGADAHLLASFAAIILPNK